MLFGTADPAGRICAGSHLQEDRPVLDDVGAQKHGCAPSFSFEPEITRFAGIADSERPAYFQRPAVAGENGFRHRLQGEAVPGAPMSTTQLACPFGTEVRPSCSPDRTLYLKESDIGNLREVLGHEVARNTRRNYGVQWQNFIAWALINGVQALPAEPVQVAAYLAERIEENGHKPATLRTAAAAIAFVHKSAGLDDPCASPEVKRTLRGATRKAGMSQKQAEALTVEMLEVIRSTVYNPRPGRGGRLESRQSAMCRGNLDIALISVMRDAMLRVSEAAGLTWSDIEMEHDGTGRLLIRRSKTDSEGLGSVAFVSAQTMAALGLIRKGKADSESVFGLRPNQISTRIKRAAQDAGLGDRFSGHSPRVGMARDLARVGIELPSLMTAGRWRSPAMPAHYIRNEVAGRGAVAQFYGHHRPS